MRAVKKRRKNSFFFPGVESGKKMMYNIKGNFCPAAKKAGIPWGKPVPVIDQPRKAPRQL
ncbi:MAG: hypothetical protein IIV90_02445 [Oscillospiraceae bacterium]|nr:hypothetical protein [Oscillospiraceae bacterium]